MMDLGKKVELTKKIKKDGQVLLRIEKSVVDRINEISTKVGQNRADLIRDAIEDRLIYLQGYLNDKEDGLI